MKPVRPIQPVKALVIKEDEAGISPMLPKKTSSVKTPTGFKTPMYIPPTSPAVNKDEIEIVVTDDIEKYKRNKTFRKSLRMSVKRPVSSPAQVDYNCISRNFSLILSFMASLLTKHYVKL